MASAGGGGSSASYPDYVEFIHKAWLENTSYLPANLQAQFPDGGFTGILAQKVDPNKNNNPYDATTAISTLGGRTSNLETRLLLLKDELKDDLKSINETDLDVKLKQNWEGLTKIVKDEFNSYVSDSLDSDPDTQISQIRADAITTANGTINNAVSGAYSNTSSKVGSLNYLSLVNSRSLIGDIVTKTFDELPDMNGLANADRNTVMADIYTSVTSQANDLVTNSINSAVDAIALDVLTNAVSAYEDETDTRMIRNVGRLAGGMADIGAINSSAYVQGNAFMEAERARDVNKYSADLKIKIFEIVLQIKNNFQAQLVGAEAQVYQSSLSGRIQEYLGSMQEYTKVYLAQLSEVYKQYISHLSTIVDVDKSSFLTNLNKFFDLQNVKLTYDKQFVNQNVAQLGQMRLAMNDQMIKTTQVIKDIEMLNIASLTQYYNKSLETTVSRETWDLDVWQHASNLLGSPAGGVVTTKGPSPAQQMLSTVFSGASAAAMFL